MQPTEADNEIEEEHLLNFVVNSLGKELALDLSEDAEATAETFCEDLGQPCLRNDRRLAARKHRPRTSHRPIRT